jgi:murein DD-endopeptidase MepM/ murein hydrolase activator NlpD
MFRLTLVWLVFLYSALAVQIELFSVKSKEHVYLFTQNYHLNKRLADKILEQNLNFPIDILILQNNQKNLNAYLLTTMNQNLELNVTKNNAFQKAILKTAKDKYFKKESIFSYQSPSSVSVSNLEQKKYLMSAFDTFFQHAGIPPNSITVLSENKVLENLSLPSEIKALLLEGNGIFMFAFIYKGNIYDRNGISISDMQIGMPLESGRLSEGYSKSRLHPILNYFRPHEGVDFAAREGSGVKSVLDGYITDFGYNPIIGNYAKIMHKNGFETVYGHLSKLRTDLKVGAKIANQEVVGLVGSTGLATGPHLHFGVKKDGVYIDPAIFFAKRYDRITDKDFFIFAQDAKNKILQYKQTQQAIRGKN